MRQTDHVCRWGRRDRWEGVEGWRGVGKWRCVQVGRYVDQGAMGKRPWGGGTSERGESVRGSFLTDGLCVHAGGVTGEAVPHL